MIDENKIREMIDKMAIEPEFICWKEKDYLCMIARNPSRGNYCGYVGIPKEHPWYGKNWDDVEIGKIEVYGGITHTSDDHWRIKIALGDCFVWWLGFETTHWDDLTMYDVKNNMTTDGKTYKDFEFIKAEVKKLVWACEKRERTIFVKGQSALEEECFYWLQKNSISGRALKDIAKDLAVFVRQH